MTIVLTGRHFELTPAIREHAEEKLSKLGRLIDNLDIEVKLDSNKHRQICSIIARGKGGTYTGEVTGDDLYAAINESVDVLARQLRKGKTSRLAHRREGAASIRHFGDPTEPGSASGAEDGSV
jgi:putative sigma-54 modulation protein